MMLCEQWRIGRSQREAQRARLAASCVVKDSCWNDKQRRAETVAREAHSSAHSYTSQVMSTSGNAVKLASNSTSDSPQRALRQFMREERDLFIRPPTYLLTYLSATCEMFFIFPHELSPQLQCRLQLPTRQSRFTSCVVQRSGLGLTILVRGRRFRSFDC